MATASYGGGSMRPTYTSCSEHFKSREQEDEAGASPNFLPLLPIQKTPKDTSPGAMSSFLQLPAEIRLHIYSLLLLPSKSTDLLPSYHRVSSSTQDYFDYERKLFGTDRPATADLSNPTLLLRTIDPLRYGERYPAGHLKNNTCVGVDALSDEGTDRQQQGAHMRESYSVRCDRFRARCMRTTYHCVNNPGISDSMGIMGACKQIHSEAAELMYGYYSFDFDTHVEAMQPFLADLTPYSRSCIRSARVVKRAIAYEKEFDRCEWSNAMSYLSAPNHGIFLRKLDLGVVAGRPGANGWDRIPKYTAGDFGLLKDTEDMEWLRDVLAIRGLQDLDVSAVVEHCPPATNSTAMARYVRFSASIEGALAQFLKNALLKPVD